MRRFLTLASLAALCLVLPTASALALETTIDARLDLHAQDARAGALALPTLRVPVALHARAADAPASSASPHDRSSSDAHAWDVPAQAEALESSVVEAAATPGGRAVAGAALYLAFQALRSIALGIVGGYARISKDDVLDHAQRDAFYQAVLASPGLSATELQARFALGWGTTIYHLDRLERAGLVASERSGLARRYYARAAMPSDERAKRAVLAKPALSRLASRVLAEPGLAQRDLAARLGLSASAAAKQLAELEQAGLVARAREGKLARVTPTSDLHALAGPVAVVAAGEGAPPRAAA